MAGIQVISQELAAVGIKVTPIYPQYAARTADLTNGTYDLALDNNAAAGLHAVELLPAGLPAADPKQQTAQLNWERFSSPSDWNLVQQAGSTPVTDTAKLNSIYSQLEKDFLQQLPQIPVWYNGAWFQGNTKYWTRLPASGTGNQNTPVMWGGYLGAMTTVYALAAPGRRPLQPEPSTVRSRCGPPSSRRGGPHRAVDAARETCQCGAISPGK